MSMANDHTVLMALYIVYVYNVRLIARNIKDAGNKKRRNACGGGGGGGGSSHIFSPPNLTRHRRRRSGDEGRGYIKKNRWGWPHDYGFLLFTDRVSGAFVCATL